jgi:Holliday junction resolvase
MPDVLTSNPAKLTLAIELKSTHSTNCYVTESEDIDLKEFCDGFGAEPVLGYKFKSRGRRRRIWLCHADDCRLTDGGHRALSRKNADSVAFLVVLPATGQQPAEVRKL